jgi:hypothetical protein
VPLREFLPNLSQRRQFSYGCVTIVAPDVSRPVTAGTSVAAQKPTEPQEVKSSYVPRWVVWLVADLSESGAFAIT